MEKITHIKSYLATNHQKFIDICAALLVFFLPFSPALPNLLLAPLILLVAFNPKNIKIIRFLPIIFYAVAILIIVILALVNSSLLEDISMYSRYFLVLLLFFLYTQIKNIKYTEYAFISGTFIAVLISSFSVGQYMIDHPGYLLDVGEKVNKLLLLERPYFGALLFLSVFVCLKNAEKSIKNYIYYLLASVFTAFSIFLSARLAIGLCCFLFFVFLFKSTKINIKNKVGLMLGMVVLFGIAMGSSDNLRSRFHLANNDFEKTIWLIKQGEPRFIIWPCSFEIIREDMHLMTGLMSTEKVKENLAQCYCESIVNQPDKEAYYLNETFNSHNQFLSFFLLGGILPFILLIAMFAAAFFSKRISFEQKLLFLLFMGFFLVENALYRQLGCFLFGIFVALYSNRGQKNIPE